MQQQPQRRARRIGPIPPCGPISGDRVHSLTKFGLRGLLALLAGPSGTSSPSLVVARRPPHVPRTRVRRTAPPARARGDGPDPPRRAAAARAHAERIDATVREHVSARRNTGPAQSGATRPESRFPIPEPHSSKTLNPVRRKRPPKGVRTSSDPDHVDPSLRRKPLLGNRRHAAALHLRTVRTSREGRVHRHRPRDRALARLWVRRDGEPRRRRRGDRAVRWFRARRSSAARQ